MKFKEYQHVERFGTIETEEIEIGTCYVFPKIDGTNGSVWLDDGKVMAGSRRRELSIGNDNAGFLETILKDNNISKLLTENPTLKLFGEWLVPHSLKTYREIAWRKFYVFDVCIEIDEEIKYLPYEEYSILLHKYNVEYIPAIAIIKNGNYETFIKLLEKNTFLIEDGKGFGEGIVIKNYDYRNRFGRITWAKIVSTEFKEKHIKEMGVPEINAKEIIEQKIVDKYLTKEFVEKEFAKIVLAENGWMSKLIPRLFGIVYHEFIKDEIWSILKEFKQPLIDFRRLKKLIDYKIKELKGEIF